MLKTLINISKLTLVFGTGLVCGVIAGILTAPKSGKELRSEIYDQSLKLKEKAKHKIGEIEDKGVSRVRAVGHSIRDVADKMCLKIDTFGNKEKIRREEKENEFASL